MQVLYDLYYLSQLLQANSSPWLSAIFAIADTDLKMAMVTSKRKKNQERRMRSKTMQATR